MPPEEPVVSAEQPHERPAVEQTAVNSAAVGAHDAYEPIDEDDWLDEPEELPRRPRRRLLGAGGNPIFLALLGLLLIACGFIGGVLIEKGETSSSSPTGSAASSLASRFRALRGGAAGAGASAAGGSSGSSSGFARPTAGTVSFLSGDTLYVTTSEGNTVKVTTSPGTTVTKSVKTSVSGIHPGETVTVTGEAGTGGAVSAESISVGSAAGGGLAALFGGAGGSGGGTGSAGRGGAASGGAGGGQALFGGG
jgi:hypothetical protein